VDGAGVCGRLVAWGDGAQPPQQRRGFQPRGSVDVEVEGRGLVSIGLWAKPQIGDEEVDRHAEQVVGVQHVAEGDQKVIMLAR
jgi:hypothetical protein